jgi:signal recognition particle subunit SRP54
MEEKLRRADFNFQDFLDQIEQMSKMGPLKDLLGMIPGMGGMADQVDEKEFARMKAIIQSMTNVERNHPELITGPRRQRIARGSGVQVKEVNTLMKNFREMRKMLKKMKRGKGMLSKMFGGGMPGLPGR